MKINRTFKQRNLKGVYDVLTKPWFLDLWRLPFLKFVYKTGTFGERIFYKLQKLRFLVKRKPAMPFCNYFITSCCTMRCANCNFFINIYEKNIKISFETFKRDIDTLLKSIDCIHGFQIIGGEPLLIKELPQILEYAANKKQIHNIFFTTNCTIKFSDELIKALKKNRKKVSVQISDYRKVAKIKTKYDEIKKLLIDNRIPFSNYQEKEGHQFHAVPTIYNDNLNYCEKELENKFQNCCAFNYAISISDGKIFNCSVPLYLNYNNPSILNQEDVICLTNSNLSEKIIEYYSKPYYNTCMLCHFIDNGGQRGTQEENNNVIMEKLNE